MLVNQTGTNATKVRIIVDATQTNVQITVEVVPANSLPSSYDGWIVCPKDGVSEQLIPVLVD